MNSIVVRLAGVEQTETRVFNQEVINIGTDPACDVCINLETVDLPPQTTLLSIRRQDGVYRISTLDPNTEVTRDGEAVSIGDSIDDGDTIYFGATGIRIRFFSLTDPNNFNESLRMGTALLAISRDSAPPDGERGDVPRTDVALVFVKQLLRELVAEISRRMLYAYAIAGIAASILILLIYVNTAGYFQGRRNNNAIGELKQVVGETRTEIDKMRGELERTREESEFVRSSLLLPEKIVSSYGRGVCLIYGTYSFIDPRAGREVRFKEPSGSENPIGPDGSLNLQTEGNGRVYEVEFTGTGFLGSRGLILTNRHVVQPWEEDDLASLIKMRGFRPRLKELLAYFPQVRQPFTLRLEETLQEEDVALCSFAQGSIDLPELPLDERGGSIASGQPVVLLGYPAGLEGLRARVDEGARGGTRRFGNLPYRIQLDDLAASYKIRPQSTQGHISDISPLLVYDARTDQGGSGGPVFGANGRVIGINQAIYLNAQATTNFGVPIRYGIELLRKYQ
jgi:serine protease Do